MARPGFLPIGLLWLAFLAATLLGRPLLPIDETRYLSVAWEMWRDHSFLVPRLEGIPYSHKPPLLFWLFHMGWTVFGVDAWWPRLVNPLLLLLNLRLAAGLYRLLWPWNPEGGRRVVLLLLGCTFWSVSGTLVMFDMLLVACSLLALTGLFRVLQRGESRGWWLFGLGTGLGFLAKGPVILLPILGPALLAPAIGLLGAGSRKRWFGRLLLALLLAVGIALAWAIPAALRGGERFGREILWGQVSGRLVSSFAHGRPWWWYLPLLPALFFPWVFWPRIGKGLSRLRLSDPGVRIVGTWLLPAALGFFLVSGKQAHYLLPLFPPLALLAARGLAELPRGGARDLGWLGGVLILLGVAGAFLPVLGTRFGLPAWIHDGAPLWGAVPILGGLLVNAPVPGLDGILSRLCLVSACVALWIHFALVPVLAPVYDLGPVSRELGRVMETGAPVAYRGHDNGEFLFLGRLPRSLTEISDPEELRAWKRSHPDGWVLYHEAGRPGRRAAGAVFTQPYREGALSLWKGTGG
ncbi:MAG: ArnT family glycosyltransferase [Planctomycetota bacterium]